MTIQLKLDTSAVESLFPEGSEARLTLQQAVIQNIVDRMPSSSGMEDFVYQQFIKKQFVDVLMNNTESFAFKQKLEKVAKKVIDDLFDQQIYQVIQTLYNQLHNDKFEQLEQKLDKKIEIFFIQHEQNILVNTKSIITRRMSAIVQEAFKDLSPPANNSD